MGLKGIIVNGTTYQYDYEYLDNKPEIPGLPSCDYNDDGKVLTIGVNNCDPYLTWQEAPGLPSYSDSDNGKVLTIEVDSCTPYLVWRDNDSSDSGGLPSYDYNDEGKVLTIGTDDSGEPRSAWAEPETLLPTCYTEGYVLTADGMGDVNWTEPETLPACNTEGYILTANGYYNSASWTRPANLPSGPQTAGYIPITGQSGVLGWIAFSEAVNMYGGTN